MSRNEHDAALVDSWNRLSSAARTVADILDGGERDPTWHESQELENAAIAYGRASREHDKREAEIEAEERAAAQVWEAKCDALVEKCLEVVRMQHAESDAEVQAIVESIAPDEDVVIFSRVLHRLDPDRFEVPF